MSNSNEKWCKQNISKEAFYIPKSINNKKLSKDEINDFFQNIKNKYDFFLKNQKNDPLTPVAEFDDLNTLQYAALCGYHYYIESLDEKFFKDDSSPSGSYTPLHCASQNGHIKTVETIIDKGANINNANNEYKLTPMHTALINNNSQFKLSGSGCIEAIFDILFKKNTGLVEAKSFDGTTPCHQIASNGILILAKKIIKSSKVSAFFMPNNAGLLPIHKAILNMQTELACKLLDIPEMVNVKDSKMRNLIHYAVYSNDLKLIKRIYYKHPQLINEIDENRETPIKYSKKIEVTEDISSFLNSINKPGAPLNNHK